MIKRSFDPGFRIALHQKDLNLALDSGRKLGVPLPTKALARHLFTACRLVGGEAWDNCLCDGKGAGAVIGN